MGTILKNVIRFTGLVAGVPAVLPHRLNINDIPVIPQLGAANADGFLVAADAINLTVTRTTGTAAVDIYVEHWHTIESVLPPGNLAGLVPFFIINNGGGTAELTPIPIHGVTFHADAGVPLLYGNNGATVPAGGGVTQLFAGVQLLAGTSIATINVRATDSADGPTQLRAQFLDDTVVIASSAISNGSGLEQTLVIDTGNVVIEADSGYALTISNVNGNATWNVRSATIIPS